jgi:hypothetical protein
LKLDWATSSEDPISKIPITEIGQVEWLKVKALSSSPSISKKRSDIDGVNLIKVYYMHAINITVKSLCAINLCK